MGDLRGLIEAVEAGVISTDLIMAAIDEPSDQINALAAFDGYLDAAKALHEALLPDREWRLRDDGRAWVWRTASDMHSSEDEADNTARAWLLAVLRALEAEGK